MNKFKNRNKFRGPIHKQKIQQHIPTWLRQTLKNKRNKQSKCVFEKPVGKQFRDKLKTHIRETNLNGDSK